MDRSTFDWVGMGALNPGAGVKVPPCGVCHPGSGSMEFARDITTEQATATLIDQATPIGDGTLDGDFRVGVGANKADFQAEFPNPFVATGVVEGDCLLCHFSGYNFGARFKQLTYRNYQWAGTVGAGLGSLASNEKLYTFDDTVKPGFKSGTWLVDSNASGGITDEADYPTVDYSTGIGSGKVIDDAGTLKLNGASVNGTPPSTACILCHGGADLKKRAFVWGKDSEDVHYAAGLSCLDCHGMVDPEDSDGDEVAGAHNIGKGYARLGSVRTDLDGTMAKDCVDCHLVDGILDAATAHGAAFPGAEFHFGKISCETCHIPQKTYTAGAMIDMSSGNQVWYLTNSDTIKSALDFGGNVAPWAPFNKPYDPDGPMGPMAEKLYPFSAKTSVWFGYLLDGSDTVQPYIMRHALEAYNNATAKPKVTVHYVKDGTDLLKPSVSDDADIAAMLDYLNDVSTATPAGATPVFVNMEKAFVLDTAGTGIEELPGIANTENDHNFSMSHNVRNSSEALGANGCTDCHAPGAALFDTMQVFDLPGYLAYSYKNLIEPYAEPSSVFQGYSEEAVERLESDPASTPAHEMIVSFAQDGANTCAQCHLDSVMDFKETVHYSGRSVVTNENFFFPGGGKHGMLDRACALVGSNMLLNMLTTGYVDLDAAKAGDANVAQQCGKCHSNYYNTLMEGFVAMQAGPVVAEQMMLSGLDCLVCHAEEYEFDLRKTYEPDPTGLNMGFGTIDGVPQRIRQDRSFEAIDSIGEPTGETCLRCHEHGRTDYKRGELPDPEHDVHYALGVSADNACTFCHEPNNHKFNRGQMVNGDIFASDYPANSEENDASCAGCHTNRPHSSGRLNDHIAKVSCETCHITMTSGPESTIWADGGFLGLAKGEDNRPTKLYTKKLNGEDLTIEEIWEEYKQRPVYLQFSGLTSFLAQAIPLPNPGLLDDEGQPTAPRIYPFKTVINPMPFDGRFYGVGVADVDMNGDQINDYSMFAAMQMFEDQYKMLEFMDQDFDFSLFMIDPNTGMLVTTVGPNDPTFPSYAAMAQMAQFPTMLFFDKYTFGYNWYQNLQEMADAGEILTWDVESGRTLTAKDMKTAVGVGMSRMIDMMAQMGFTPPPGMSLDDLKGMYSNFTDDQLVTMAAPPGSEMQMMLYQMGYEAWATYPAYSNGITLGGHGVTREDALYCADCHEPDGVFSQPVEIPSYGPNSMPLFHWEFFAQALLDKAEAGEPVDDIWAIDADSGEPFALSGDDFEMGPGMAFVTATQAADALGITYGLGGSHIAVLTPTTWLGTNWDALGYDEARVKELTGQTDGGGYDGDVGKGGSSSECFITALGTGTSASGGAWLAGLLGFAGIAGLAASTRRKR